MDVATVQANLLKAVHEENCAINPDELERLQNNLLDLNTLFNQYAVPLHLHESKLEILHSADHRDEHIIRTTWFHIVGHYHPGRNDTPIEIENKSKGLENALRKLSRLRPSMFFPVDYILALLENRTNTVEKYILCSNTNENRMVSESAGRVHGSDPIHLLRECDVSYDAIYDAYSTLFRVVFRPRDNRNEDALSQEGTTIGSVIPRDDDTARLRILNHTVLVLLSWVEYVRSQEASYNDRQTFPGRVNNLLNSLAEYESELNKFRSSNFAVTIEQTQEMCKKVRKLLTTRGENMDTVEPLHPRTNRLHQRSQY